MEEIDCRGLACPQPVLNTRDALSGMDGDRLRVLVDNDAAAGNVTRFAESQGCRVESSIQDGAIVLTVIKTAHASGPMPEITCPAPAAPRLVVRVGSRFMGSGSDELGRVLMKAFLKSLAEATLRPDAVVFYNSGVHLVCSDSEHLDAVRALEASGVRILACGTCLDFFHRKDDLAAGVVTNMFEIIETLSGADRVVSP